MPHRLLQRPVLHQYPLDYFDANRALFEGPEFPVERHLRTGRYPQRMMRYWIAHEALKQEARRLGRPLRIIDLGCERGLMKLLARDDIQAHWTGLDWNIGRPSLAKAAYDDVRQADFDKRLPLDDAVGDALVSNHVFEHLPRPEFTLGEAYRVLRPGGLLVLGIPVAPKIVARLRETQYREEVQQGDRIAGRHINKFHVRRALRLCHRTGFDIQWWTGTHLYRKSASPLEQSRLWVRASQCWGWWFPSLGRELYILARKPESPRPRQRSRPRPAGPGQP